MKKDDCHQIIAEVNFVLFTEIQKLNDEDLQYFETFMNKYNDDNLDSGGFLKAVILEYVRIIKRDPEIKVEDIIPKVEQLKLL